MARTIKEGDQYLIECPGCECLHILDHRWSFNGSMDKPTFRPSYLIHGSKDQPNYQAPRCHSWISDGRIQFLNDSTHKLKGQTVDLPEFDEDRSLWPWVRKYEDDEG